MCWQAAAARTDVEDIAIYVERSPQHGQIVREIVEVSSVVERTAARPSFSPLFIACLINK